MPDIPTGASVEMWALGIALLTMYGLVQAGLIYLRRHLNNGGGTGGSSGDQPPGYWLHEFKSLQDRIAGIVPCELDDSDRGRIRDSAQCLARVEVQVARIAELQRDTAIILERIMAHLEIRQQQHHHDRQ